MKAVVLAFCCHLLVMSAFAASFQSSSGDVIVSVSGDFKKAGEQGRHCSLPQTSDVTISVGDVTVILKVNKSPGVTQDAPVFIIGDDGRLRRDVSKNEATYALYHDTENGTALMITCPRAGEEQPLVEGTVLHQGRLHHLRQSRRRRRDVGMETNQDGGHEYMLSEVPKPKASGPLYDAVYPPGVHKHSPKPPTTRRNLAPSDDPEPFEVLELKDPEVGDDDDESAEIDAALGTALRRRRRQTVNGQNIFIDTIAVIAYDIYKKYYDASTETTAATKDSDAVTEIRKLYALLFSEADWNFKLIGNRLPYTISLRLAGYAIAKTAGASSWTESNKVFVSGSSRALLDSSTALDDMKAWIENLESRLDYYILFTEYDLTANGSITNAGVAFVKGVCSAREGYNAAVVEADDFAAAVAHALHEVGHGFGAQHDGDGNTCSAADNYIMEPGGAAITDANRAYIGHFSQCSLDYFAETFADLAASSTGQTCIHEIDTPVDVPDVSGIIPGQLYDITTQCKRAVGDESYVCNSLVALGDSMCSITYCSVPDSGGSCTSISLLRGTSCGDKKWCENSLCVSSPDAPSMNEACPFGDRVTPPYSNDARTCSQLVSEEPGSCYSSYIAEQCCQSCAAAKGTTPGCEYGDGSTWCQASLCARYTASSLEQCCATCPSETATTVAPAPTTTTTAATTTTPTTTTPTTTTPTTTTPTTTTPTTNTPTTTTPTTTTPTTTTPTTTTPTTTTPTTTTPTTTTPETTTSATTTAAPVPTTTTSTSAPNPMLEGQITDGNAQCRLTEGVSSSASACNKWMTGESARLICSRGLACSFDTNGCRRRQPALNGTSCGDKMWCINGACVESEDAPSADAMCLFGDMQGELLEGYSLTCADVATVDAGFCNERTIRDMCCKSCGDLKKLNSECPYGDKPGQPFSNSDLTCSELVTQHPGHCYDQGVRRACCHSCSLANSQDAACPYGDRSQYCSVSKCSYNGWAAWCCSTCANA